MSFSASVFTINCKTSHMVATDNRASPHYLWNQTVRKTWARAAESHPIQLSLGMMCPVKFASGADKSKLQHLGNKIIPPEEQISFTLGTKIVVQGTHLAYSGKKLLKGTHLNLRRNKNIASKEQISSTRGTRILSWRNTSCLLEEQKYCWGTHFIYLGNNNLVSEEHISSTWGTRLLRQRNNSSHTQRTKKLTTVEQISSI
jgi:hypothetical protein